MKKIKNNQALHKQYCEIEGCSITDANCLQWHHIIERKQIGTSNHPLNTAIICSVHHNLIHAGKLRIIGVYPGTKLPTGRILVYEINGKKNIDIDESYFNYKPPQMKIYYKEENDTKR